MQSLLFNNKYQQLFSPTDFDLVISDEAHRSISGNARAVFDYFVGYKLCLTATPRDFLKNFKAASALDPRETERRLLLDTYRTFGCESGQPTFRYSLLDGVKDEYLVNPIVVDARTDVTAALLSEQGFIVSFTDEEGEEHQDTFKQREFEKRFYSEATNLLFCKTFLEHALRDPISGEIGKSIMFAVSQNHAAKLAQILNQMAERMYPGKYQSDFAVQVTSQIPDAQQFTINFANNNLLGSGTFLPTYLTSKARVCVTVGMMTTGYDCQDILNLGLLRPIFSLDKQLARKAKHVAFFKVDNDGFDLGAQRRPIEINDLPLVKKDVIEYLCELKKGLGEGFSPETGLIIEKVRLAEGGEFNLSGERYRSKKADRGKYPHVMLGTVCDINPEIVVPEEVFGPSTLFNYIDISCVENESGRFLGPRPLVTDEAPSRARRVVRSNDVLVSTVRPNLKAFTLIKEPPERAIASTGFAVLRANADQILPGFLLSILRSDKVVQQMIARMGKGSYPSINQSDVQSLKIPLPELEVQEEIVAEMDGYQKVIDGARAVVENYRPNFRVEPEWPTVELGEVCSLGGTITSDIDPAMPYFGADSIESNTGRLLKVQTAEDQSVQGPVYEFSGRRLLYSKIRPYLNKLAVVDLHGYCSSDMYPLVPDYARLDYDFLAAFMLSASFNRSIAGYYERARIPKINRSQLFSVNVPLPPIAIQKQVVAQLQAERALVEGNIELIFRLEARTRDLLARV